MTFPERTQSAQLHARLSEIVNYLGNTRQQLETFVQIGPPSLHAQRADPEGWTVAESLEHLGMIEDSVGRIISSMAKQLRSDNAVETESASLLHALDEFGVPRAKDKFIAPLPYRPTGTLSAAEALEKLRDIRLRVLGGVNKVNGLDLTKATFPHPFLGPLNGYQWLLLIGQHEMRHLNQMKDTVQKLAVSPTASASAASQGSV